MAEFQIVSLGIICYSGITMEFLSPYSHLLFLEYLPLYPPSLSSSSEQDDELEDESLARLVFKFPMIVDFWVLPTERDFKSFVAIFTPLLPVNLKMSHSSSPIMNGTRFSN